MIKFLISLIFLTGCAHMLATDYEVRRPALAGEPTLYPDPTKTPGVVRAETTEANVCTPGFTKEIRDVPESVKNKVFISYMGKVPEHPGENYEVDHFISLELGGANDVKNLWPQPYAPVPGARQKDVVETYLKEQVCEHKVQSLSLNEAQKIITTDWYACYLNIQEKKPCDVPKAEPTFEIESAVTEPSTEPQN